MFASLFGGPGPVRAPPAPSALEGITHMREHLRQMEKREKFMESKIANKVEEARQKLAKKDKRGALLQLKLKKGLEAELATLQNTKFTMEQQMMMLEAATVNVQTVKVMKEGARAQRREIEQLGGVEAVEDAMEEMQDGMEDMAEINEALGGGSSIDLADEEAELDAMMAAVHSSPPPPASSRRPYSNAPPINLDAPRGCQT
jgi:charged multivesicular body protein 4